MGNHFASARSANAGEFLTNASFLRHKMNNLVIIIISLKFGDIKKALYTSAL